MRRTLGSTVLTYAFALLATLGLPLIVVAILPITGIFSYYAPLSPFLEGGLIYLLGLLIAINPIATAVVTEAILVSNQSAFYFTIPLNNGFNLPLISPWLPFMIFCFVFGWILTFLSILAVRRVER
jgi:hypothetical protein